MITIISSTNRPGSNTRKLAEEAKAMFIANGEKDVQFLSLEELTADMFGTDMYNPEAQSKKLHEIQDKYIIPARKFYFVIPEYNGGFPGILKTFIDACSMRKGVESFKDGKKAAVLGLAMGRAGNLRGLEHFLGILNYLQITVMPNIQPLAMIHTHLDEAGKIKDEHIRTTVEKHVQQFIAF